MAILPTMILLGGGFALGFPSINVQATDGVDDDEQGLASGLVQTSGQVGAALVLAITTAIIASDGDTRPTPRPAFSTSTGPAWSSSPSWPPRAAMALVPFVIRRSAVALATEEQ